MKKIILLIMLSLITSCSLLSEQEADELPVLKQLGFKRNFDPNTDPVAKFLEKETGYKVEYEVLPMENDDEKLALIMANKEAVDMIKVTPSQYHKLASQGYLEPLDNLLNTYGKTLLKVNDDESWASAKINGITYGIPERSPLAFAPDAIAIRRDILESLDEEIPQTLNEFYNLLLRIKNETDLIPMTGYQPLVHQISGAFGINAEWSVENGQIVNRVEKRGFQEYLEFMRKLYQEGLLDLQWPINNHGSARDKFGEGKAAMMASYGWGVSGVLVPTIEENFNTKVDLIMGLESRTGRKGAYVDGTGVNWYIVIPKFSENKEHAMKYMEMKVQEDFFRSFTIGEPDVHWKIIGGKRVPIMPKFIDDKNNADWFMTSTRQEDYKDYWTLRIRKDVNIGKTFDRMLTQVEYGQPEATSFAPPLSKNAQFSYKLLELEREYMIDTIVNPNPQYTYEEFLEMWYEQGGLDTKTEYNMWFNKIKN
ncbi:MAG TPA: extracellular solute-binding protein [Erysipelothrix sp.]